MEAKIEQKHISLLSEWLDPMTDQEIIEETLRQLQRATKPEHIAFGVVSKLQGVGKITTEVIASKKFIQTLIDLAPNLERGANVPAVAAQIRDMKNVMDWDHIENKLQKMRENMERNDDIILVIKSPKHGTYETIKNILAEKEIKYCKVYTSNFDGDSHNIKPNIEFGGNALQVINVLRKICDMLADDDEVSVTYTSNAFHFQRQRLSLQTAIKYAEHEAEICKTV